MAGDTKVCCCALEWEAGNFNPVLSLQSCAKYISLNDVVFQRLSFHGSNINIAVFTLLLLLEHGTGNVHSISMSVHGCKYVCK